MHIGMIYADNQMFPPDIRVQKEISSLCEAGHRVTVLARRIPTDALPHEKLAYNNAEVNRVFLRNPSYWEELWRLFALQNKNWIPLITNFIQEKTPDVIHVHDFNLVPTTLGVCRRIGLPVIADLHENMPAARRAYRSNLRLFPKLISAIGYNYHLWRWHEARALRQCCRVIVVVPEAAERLYNYGISKNKIVVVSNTEDENTFHFEPEKVDNGILEKYRPFWVANYIGGINSHRGLDTVIRALPIVRKIISNLRLVIVGAKRDNRPQIESLARHFGVDDIVEVIDWQPFDKIISYIFSSSVCLVPHNDFEHTQTTVPHKLFQYMICRKPVLVSNCRPLARIVNDARCGLVFEANNYADFAKKLVALYQDSEQMAIMGQNGHRAALGSYSWRHDSKRLVQMYDELAHEVSVIAPI